jgi:hypothetical protein
MVTYEERANAHVTERISQSDPSLNKDRANNPMRCGPTCQWKKIRATLQSSTPVTMEAGSSGEVSLGAGRVETGTQANTQNIRGAQKKQT